MNLLQPAPASSSLPATAVPHPAAIRAFYFFYLASTGVMLPFFPHFLRGRGLSGRQISWVLAAAPLMHMVAPVVWGWLSDRTRRPDLMLRVAVFGAAACFFPLAFVTSFAAILGVFFTSQLFATPIPGLSDTLAIMRVRHAGDDYGRIRAFGAPSFILACLAAGFVLARRGQVADPLTPLSSGFFLIFTFGVALFVRGRGRTARPTFRAARGLLADRRLLALFSMTALHWGCTAPFHGFFSILVRDRGLPVTVTSHGFVTSVTAELIVFWNFKRISRLASLPRLLALVTFASGIRWIIVATSSNPVVLVGVQALHGMTFGLFWALTVSWVGKLVPDELRATGQTLLTGTTFGLGYLVAILTTGFLYDAAGSAVPALWLAAGLNLAQTPLILAFAKRFAPPSDAPVQLAR